MWFPKFPYTNFSQINLDWVLRQIRELSEWMNRYFKQIRQDLDDEINNRIEGDKALGERIDKEITDRTEADHQLQNNIDAEEAAREAADQQLQNNINAEEAAREAADTALGGRIDKEIQDRTEADNALGQRIDTETSERKAADQQLQTNIDAEKAAREAADQQLQNGIDTLRGDAILKDGSTTTTAAIPFAQGIKTGSITEATPDTGVSIEAQLDLNSHKITALADGTDNTDAVNLGQMSTADEQAVGEANSYTDSQLEAFAADVHSIPAGGSSGQVLAKVDGTDYNVTWVDQQGGGGDDPNAIRKDGTTTTTAPIPFAQGIKTDTIEGNTNADVTFNVPIDMANHKISHLTEGVSDDEAVNVEQLKRNTFSIINQTDKLIVVRNNNIAKIFTKEPVTLRQEYTENPESILGFTAESSVTLQINGTGNSVLKTCEINDTRVTYNDGTVILNKEINIIPGTDNTDVTFRFRADAKSKKPFGETVTFDKGNLIAEFIIL